MLKLPEKRQNKTWFLDSSSGYFGAETVFLVTHLKIAPCFHCWIAFSVFRKQRETRDIIHVSLLFGFQPKWSCTFIGKTEQVITVNKKPILRSTGSKQVPLQHEWLNHLLKSDYSATIKPGSPDNGLLPAHVGMTYKTLGWLPLWLFIIFFLSGNLDGKWK